MKTTLLTAGALLLAACNYTPREVTPPATFTAAEPIPPRPTDVGDPLAGVMWMLNYDVSQFDTVWRWLHDDVPPGAARARAIAAATLVAVAELDRTDVRAEGLAAFDEAIPNYPTDERLPLWRAYVVWLEARDSKDRARIDAAFAGIRAASTDYQAFTLFGVTLAAGGWEDAPRALLEEASAAFATIVTDTASLQHATDGLDLDRSRRLWDSPIAPYNIPAMQAMSADLELRLGNKDKATVGYYTALKANHAARWPWRAEVQRRMENVDATEQAFAARPATAYAFGSQGLGAMGMPANPSPDPRFKGRVGNGSCTVCHTHVSTFDTGETAANVGWVKVKVARPKEVPNLQGIGLLLPDGAMPVPGGFGIGPYVDVAGPRDFPLRDDLFDGTTVLPAEPGVYFVAAQATVDGKTWQGYLPREFGKQWFIEVKAGQMLDVTDSPIVMSKLPEP
ncbi:MAG: hypothetical protein JNK82_35390 [Myxococcaceae bacterium]|nr:hypothetical protein [Myxococcaceae bacterium]